MPKKSLDGSSTYSESVERSSGVKLVYNPTTRTWTVDESDKYVKGSYTTDPFTGESIFTPNPDYVGEVDTGVSTRGGIDDPPKPVSSETDADTQTEAEKEYIDLEYKTLEGDIVFTASAKSLNLHVTDTLELKGIGKYLSGLYFVSSLTKTIDTSEGLSVSGVLIKTGFGDSLKKSYSTPDRADQVQILSAEFKAGDKVKIVGENAVYSNASMNVKVPAWVKQKVLTIVSISADNTRALLSPINSWTFLTYLQKV